MRLQFYFGSKVDLMGFILNPYKLTIMRIIHFSKKIRYEFETPQRRSFNVQTQRSPNLISLLRLILEEKFFLTHRNNHKN